MKNMSKKCMAGSRYADMIGRFLLGGYFVMGGIGKLMDISGTAEFMTASGIPMAGILVWVAAFFLIAAGIGIIAGYCRCGFAFLLILFTLLVTVIFHSDWGDQTQMLMALKNLAIVGGLLMVASSCKGKCGDKSGHGHDHKHGHNHKKHNHEMHTDHSHEGHKH